VIVAFALAVLTLLTGPASAASGGFRGIFALQNPGQQVPPQVFENPNVDGIALRLPWMLIERREGEFTWGPIDQVVNEAQAHGKKVSLDILPGIFTPPWVYTAGAQRFPFLWDKPWGFPPCSEQGLPLPWDPVYLAKWGSFVQAMGQRYAASPAVVLLKLQGINAQTSEFLLPHTQPSGNQMGRLVRQCPAQKDENETWRSLGYRPSKILSAWRTAAAAQGRAFPNQGLVMETGPWGMPPIDEDGNAMGRDADTSLPLQVIEAGRAMFGRRFVVQNDGLNAVWAWPGLVQAAAGNPIAYQTAWAVTNDRTCRMNHFQQPCDPQQMMQGTINHGLSSGAQYLEIYMIDVLNPQLSGILAEAHRRLTAE
jgi:hypothetical protein